MEFQFIANVRLILDSLPGDEDAQHVATDFSFQVSDNLDARGYLAPGGMPTKNGCKAFTQTLVQGLIGNIHFAHEMDYIDSAEHLRYIIDEVTRGFAEVGQVSVGKMNVPDFG